MDEDSEQRSPTLDHRDGAIVNNNMIFLAIKFTLAVFVHRR
jgi:hypothetical protein